MPSMPLRAPSTLSYLPVPAAALRTVLSKHTVKRLRELVRARINLSGYSKMVKQDLISAILKRKELFIDIVELEDSRSKNAAQDRQERGKTFCATLDGLKCAKRRAREILKLPSNEHGKAFKVKVKVCTVVLRRSAGKHRGSKVTDIYPGVTDGTGSCTVKEEVPEIDSGHRDTNRMTEPIYYYVRTW